MKGYIRCLLTAFGDFSGYEITSKSIFELMNALKEFEVIPNVIDEFRIEIVDNFPTQKTVKRVQLTSAKYKFAINFFENNIMIEADPQIDLATEKAELNVEEFIPNAKKIFSILLNNIGKKANRISLVTTYLDEGNINTQYEKHIKPNKFFIGKDVFEWNTKSVVRERIGISGNDEEINIISNIFKTNGFIGISLPTPTNHKFDGVLYEIDINTIPENNIDRIDANFIDSFYDVALLKKRQIEGMINNDEQ